MPAGPEILAALTLALGPAYIVDRELDGEAGRWWAFVAHEESSDTDVLIRVLAPGMTEGVLPERFDREMRFVSELNEPHTVPVLTFGRTGTGLYYYTMPFVRGMSLRQRMEEGPVGFDETILVLRDIARALAYAHQKGFIHYDLRPENILLAQGTAAVVDAGLAIALQRSRPHPASHVPQGVLPYMSPEQDAGDPETDYRTDIHAWGAIAYEMLLDTDPTSEMPTVERVEADQREPELADVDSPAILFKRHGVSDQLALLVMSCLEESPAARPVNATELFTVLARIPIGALDAAIEGRSAVRWVGGSLLMAIALVIAGGLAVYHMQSAAEPADAPLLAVLPFETIGVPADSLFADGLADAMNEKLSHVPGVRIVDRQSVLAVADARHSPQATGSLLNAAYVMSATLRWYRDTNNVQRVRVTPSITRVSDGTTTWAGKPQEAALADPFSIQVALATEAAEALDVKLDDRVRARLSAHETRDTAAFVAFTTGNRLGRQNESNVLDGYQATLQSYERAYRADPHFPDAFGAAALVMMRMARLSAHPALYDSANVLARRALVLDSLDARALAASAGVAFAQDRTEDAQRYVDRALSANPSDIDARERHAELLLLTGDSAGVWRDVEHLVAVAPRSVGALVSAATTSQALRRFVDASDFLQRAQALAPARADIILHIALLDRADGDFSQMAIALADYRAHGGKLAAADLTLLRAGNDSMQQELATSSPSAYAVVTPADSFNYFIQKAQLFLARRDSVRARPLLDSTAAALRSLLTAPAVLASQRRKYVEYLAWTDAALGDRARAVAAVTSIERTPIAQQWPDGEFAAFTACNGAEIYAFLDDVEQMLVQLRRCFTLPGGYAARAISAEPALWRHAPDPRLRALLGDFNLNVKHVE